MTFGMPPHKTALLSELGSATLSVTCPHSPGHRWDGAEMTLLENLAVELGFER